jgi:hypothetical protein
MPQDNDIKNKLQQLENQQVPDLSHMNEHWQKMEGMLKPGTVAKGGSMFRKPWFQFSAVVIALISVVLLWYTFENKHINNSSVANVQSNTTKASPNTAILSNANIVIDTSKRGSSILLLKRRTSGKWNNTRGTGIAIAPTDSMNDQKVAVAAPDRQALLNKLLAELAKKADEFIIDNRKDTLIEGKDGSVLLIPANSLGGTDNVKLSLTEFYTLSDIILNKLSTTSDTNLLETGGMISVTATVNGKPVTLQKGQSIRWYMSDTSTQVQQMQLFNGVQQKQRINWIPQNSYFSRTTTRTEVRVLNIKDEPYEMTEDNDGYTVGFFMISDSAKISRDSLKALLMEKFGRYNKIHIKGKLKDNFFNRIFYSKSPRFDATEDYKLMLGDSIWMEKSEADKYGLKETAARNVQQIQQSWNGPVTADYSLAQKRFADSLSIDLKNKYSIDITTLGWINCDHFRNDRRRKVFYTADLGDSAVNYYTVLIFKNEKSIMLGEPDGNKVGFPNLPIGEPVKIISIGINKKGESIFVIKDVLITKDILNGLQFENSSAKTIKSSLNQLGK